uniref:Uncharacterized protein n=2 Tax=Kalanchoe fedtschenkoi TaxID=63787 RepID=A0A7N0UFP5_KALFE
MIVEVGLSVKVRCLKIGVFGEGLVVMGPTVVTPEDVLETLMNDGTIDAIRLKILNQLKANEDLKKNTITMVEQSKVLNTPGAEKQTKRELFDSLRQELEAPVLEKASKAVWELILDSSGLGKEIGETVEKVFCRLSGFETPIFPSSAEAPPIAADTVMANASSSSMKRKIDKVIQNEKTREVRPSKTPASKSHDGNHAAPSH